VIVPEPLIWILSAVVVRFCMRMLPDPDKARPVRSFTVKE
jgi:hypothetical protein